MANQEVIRYVEGTLLGEYWEKLAEQTDVSIHAIYPVVIELLITRCFRFDTDVAQFMHRKLLDAKKLFLDNLSVGKKLIKASHDIARQVGCNIGRRYDERCLLFESVLLVIYRIRFHNAPATTRVVLYSSQDNFLDAYPPLVADKSINALEMKKMFYYTNMLKVGLSFLKQAGGHRDHLLLLASRTTEGCQVRYTPGGGMSPATKRRLAVFRQEGGVKPTRNHHSRIKDVVGKMTRNEAEEDEDEDSDLAEFIIDYLAEDTQTAPAVQSSACFVVTDDPSLQLNISQLNVDNGSIVYTATSVNRVQPNGTVDKIADSFSASTTSVDWELLSFMGTDSPSCFFSGGDGGYGNVTIGSGGGAAAAVAVASPPTHAGACAGIGGGAGGVGVGFSGTASSMYPRGSTVGSTWTSTHLRREDSTTTTALSRSVSLLRQSSIDSLGRTLNTMTWVKSRPDMSEASSTTGLMVSIPPLPYASSSASSSPPGHAQAAVVASPFPQTPHHHNFFPPSSSSSSSPPTPPPTTAFSPSTSPSAHLMDDQALFSLVAGATNINLSNIDFSMSAFMEYFRDQDAVSTAAAGGAGAGCGGGGASMDGVTSSASRGALLRSLSSQFNCRSIVRLPEIAEDNVMLGGGATGSGSGGGGAAAEEEDSYESATAHRQLQPIPINISTLQGVIMHAVPVTDEDWDKLLALNATYNPQISSSSSTSTDMEVVQ